MGAMTDEQHTEVAGFLFRIEIEAGNLREVLSSVAKMSVQATPVKGILDHMNGLRTTMDDIFLGERPKAGPDDTPYYGVNWTRLCCWPPEGTHIQTEMDRLFDVKDPKSGGRQCHLVRDKDHTILAVAETPAELRERYESRS